MLQIAPAAKKLWGLEAKDAKSLALHHLNHEGGVWRDPTWAAPGKFNFVLKNFVSDLFFLHFYDFIFAHFIILLHFTC